LNSHILRFLLLLSTVLHVRGGDSVVVFNEIMYHPRDGDPVEWLELHNQMAVDVDISGWEIEGAGYVFPANTVIAGGGYVVVASDVEEMRRRSGATTNVFGPMTARLANGGEELTLRNHNQRIMDELSYETGLPWPLGPAGSGFSLAKKRPTLGSEEGENWSVSAELGGTPGKRNFAGDSAPVAPVLINEIAGASADRYWIEIFNNGQSPLSVAGYELEFSRSPQTPVRITNAVVIPAGELIVIEPGYKPRDGEELFLYSAGRTQLLDAVEIQLAGRARSVEDRTQWLASGAQTAGSPNVFARETNIVFNEIMYAPTGGATNEAWIELFNRGSSRVDISGWRIEGVGYSFPANSSIGQGEYLVVAQSAQAVRAKYPGLNVFGEFTGRLSRNSEQLTLVDSLSNPVDEVRYYDDLPWPEFADGGGASLELRDARADNSRPEAWAASRSPDEWQTYSYSAVAAIDNGPTRWNEFIFGLLDAGEVLLDDFSVRENPGATGRELLRNGSFENVTNSWRFVGTHRNAAIIVDPENPTNHVLRLVADGPTEHMHNHVETTLVNNQPIRNGNSYAISFRAKWLGGCNKLNTRLYFNRVARTTDLQRPVSVGTPGTRNSVAETNIGPTFQMLGHTPAAPKVAESVTVNVRAEDPDGIARCTLLWALGGTNWVRQEMNGQGGAYSGVIPAQAAAAVVQFYIEAEDKAGAISFYPAGGPASRALYKVADTQTLSPRLHNIRLIMLPSEATQLHATTNVMSNGRSGTTVVYNESEVFYDCGLHLQSSQRGRMDAARVGFTVSFPAGQLFRGVHNTITFDRSGGWSGRGGRQDEIVMRHIINQAGDSPDMYNDLVRLLAPQNTHSGTAMLLMAKYGDEFFDGSVYPKDGSMFKLELIYYPTTTVGNDPQRPKIPQPDDVVGIEIGNRGTSPEAYRWFFLAENHPGDDDYAGMMRLAQAFSLTGTNLQQRTAELMDMEQWTRTFAFKALSGDADTYGFGLAHNHLFYVPPEGKALTFPWDMDFAWTRGATESINVRGRIGQIIHTIPAYQRLYLGNLQDIVATSYNTNYMARWTAHYGSLAGQNYNGVLTYIGQRANSVRTQLRPAAAFRITSFTGDTFITNASSMVLRGTAPYTMRRLQKNTDVPGPGFSWTAAESWETVVPLKFGTNVVSIVGYDFKNVPVATNQVTIISTTGAADADDDGMPDTWETQYGLNPNLADGDGDADGDGFSNKSEYLAGTSPRDAASKLALTARAAGQQIELSFTARAGRSYRLQYKVGLGAEWRDLVTVPATNEDRVVNQPQTISQLTPALYYRVVANPAVP